MEKSFHYREKEERPRATTSRTDDLINQLAKKDLVNSVLKSGLNFLQDYIYINY